MSTSIFNKQTNKQTPEKQRIYLLYIYEYTTFLLITNLNISIKLGANHQHLRIQTLLKLLNFGKEMKFYKKIFVFFKNNFGNTLGR